MSREFYDAWRYLYNHWSVNDLEWGLMPSLAVDVERTGPAKTDIRVMLRFKPVVGPLCQPTDELEMPDELTCSGRSFPNAVVKLANLVSVHPVLGREKLEVT